MSGPKPSRGSGMGGAPSPGFGGEAVMDEQKSVAKSMMGGASGPGASSGSKSSSSQSPSGGSQNQGSQAAQTAKPKVEPREVGTIAEEAKLGVSDAWTEVKQFFSINTWLGIEPNEMDPEEKAKAEQFHAKYQQLDQDQQAVAKQMYQEKMQKKQMQEDEDKQRKKIEAQEKARSAVMPSSPQKGAKAQGGGKKRAMDKLQRDRTTMSTTQGE